MQSSAKEQDLFTDIARFWVKVFPPKPPTHKTAYLDNPDILLSGFVIVFYLLIYACTALTTYYGWYYHRNAFSSFGQEIGLYISMTFILVGELVKIFFGKSVFKMALSGMWRKSPSRCLLWIILIGVFYLAMRWSYDISTKGIAEMNSTIRTTELQRTDAPSPQIVLLRTQLANVTAQIKASDDAIKVGSNAKWQNHVTEDGLNIISKNSKSKQDLIKTQNSVSEQLFKLENENSKTLTGQINYTASLLAVYGGYAEWFLLILLFLVVLLDTIFHSSAKNNPSPTPPRQGFLSRLFSDNPPNDNRSSRNDTKRTVDVPNYTLNENRSLIGFKYNQSPVNENRSVTKIVTRSEIIEANAVCKVCQRDFQKNHKKQIYCCNECKMVDWRSRNLR